MDYFLIKCLHHTWSIFVEEVICQNFILGWFVFIPSYGWYSRKIILRYLFSLISWHIFNLDYCDFKSHTTLPLNDSYVTMLGTILTIFKYIINHSIRTCVCRRSREKQKTTSEQDHISQVIDESKMYLR